MKHRSQYWGSTKFADRIRGIVKPYAATGDEWERWRKEAKEKSPIRYWIADTLLDSIQDVINWPVDKIYDVKYYIVNRWVDQSYALVAHPKHIKRGQWMDLDNRILYCLFDELVDFVEIEKAYCNYRWDEEKAKSKRWWQVGRWRTRTWRSAEAGIDHLEWEMSLTDEEWIDDKTQAKPTAQAITAKEVFDLYTWWTQVYPNRPDPYDVSGWSAYCDSRRERGVGMLCSDPEKDKWNVDEILKKSNEIEKQYQDEEQEMLIRLIKVRKNLWT